MTLATAAQLYYMVNAIMSMTNDLRMGCLYSKCLKKYFPGLSLDFFAAFMLWWLCNGVYNGVSIDKKESKSQIVWVKDDMA